MNLFREWWKVQTSTQASCEILGLGLGLGAKGISLLQVPSGSPALPVWDHINPGVDSGCPSFPPRELLKVSRDKVYSPIVETTQNLTQFSFYKSLHSFYTMGTGSCPWCSAVFSPSFPTPSHVSVSFLPSSISCPILLSL